MRAEVLTAFATLAFGACSFNPNDGGIDATIGPDSRRDDGGIDGTPDAPDAAPDASIDAPPLIEGCPPSYTLDLTGAGFSEYRAITTALSWRVAQDACVADGVGFTGKTHLAVLADDAERIAIDGQGLPNNSWIGLTDLATEGEFIWVTNEADPPQTAGPWSGSNPDGGETSDCVRVNNTQQYDDRDCTTLNAAICECDNKQAIPSRFP